MTDRKNDKTSKDRNEEAYKLPKDKDRDYGPYGQQRPGERPDVDGDDVPDNKREEAWQPAHDKP